MMKLFRCEEARDMSYLKNIEQEKVLKLADEVSVAPGQVVSKTLVQNDAGGNSSCAVCKRKFQNDADCCFSVCGRRTEE
jgi:hypothetical protein